MKKRFLRKMMSLTAAAVFAGSLLPAALAADVSDFNDVAGHWGESHLSKMIEAGVIAGDGKGRAMPDKAIERYEAAIMLAKVFGLSLLDLDDAVTGQYTDITAGSPYVDEYINNVIAAGFMIGTGNQFEPNRGIPREEAFTALRNAFQIPDAPASYVSVFPDFDAVPAWARGHILAMEASGMIAGKNGRIAPAAVITRAEFAALLSKGAGDFIDADADFEDAELERAVIRKPGLTVSNLTAEALTVAQGVGGGDATFENCDVGVLYVRGGGDNSIRLIGSNVTELVIDTALTGGVRIVIDEESLVETVKIHSEGATLDGGGTVLAVEDYTGGSGGNGDNGGEEAAYAVIVHTVHESVTAAAAVNTDGFAVTLTGELRYEDNVFLARSASDFETVAGEDRRPLASVLDGAFTAIEINVKEIMAAIGFELVSIRQENPALSAYGEAGPITEKDGVWLKETEDRVPADFDDEFCVLILGGETAALLFACEGKAFTVTIDATGLTVNGPAEAA